MAAFKEEIIHQVNTTLCQLIQEDSVLRQDVTLTEMLLYALGFDRQGTPTAAGKRIRPLLCCLACGVIRGEHAPALIPAVSLEMIHNFSLIHDDIEDNSDIRHGIPTVWKKWGLTLSLNAGDALFAKAYKTIHQADAGGGAMTALFDEILMNLTLGQHFDISFENRDAVSEHDYLKMIAGKTVSLLSGSLEMGAIAAGADETRRRNFRALGEKIGFAFQMQDDFLGIWGDQVQFGKSVSSDITSKKMTLPILYALDQSDAFRERWARYDGNGGEVAALANEMAALGAVRYTREKGAESLKAGAELLNRLENDTPYFALLQQTLTAMVGRAR